jgi:glycosyltransferase involved in cell wall biosynthesis
MIEGRSKKWHKDFSNQYVVPHGVHFERIKRLAFKDVNKTEILYMGTLLEKQGIQLALQSLPLIIKTIPTIQLTIIGDGPYKKDLIALTKKLHLEKNVSFLGYIKSHEEMENRIAQAAIALAMYDRNADKNDFTKYADPGKIKNYLGAGVPVIMTDTAFVAQQIKKSKCGFVISYSRKELIQTLVSFLSNQKLMKTFRINAVAFATYYDWDKVFDRAFSESCLYTKP